MSGPRRIRLPEHTVEIVSDAGEGAQKAAIAFAQLCAKAGNGLWTVEIIPSEIRPPPHTTGSASGNRIRLAERSRVTNAGNRANVVLAFNEMALLSRLEAESLADGVSRPDRRPVGDAPDMEQYQRSYREVLDQCRAQGATDHRGSARARDTSLCRRCAAGQEHVRRRHACAPSTAKNRAYSRV